MYYCNCPFDSEGHDGTLKRKVREKSNDIGITVV